MGASVGSNVGLTVGSAVGSNVGLTVGSAVDGMALDGLYVGTGSVGACVGTVNGA